MLNLFLSSRLYLLLLGQSEALLHGCSVVKCHELINFERWTLDPGPCLTWLHR